MSQLLLRARQYLFDAAGAAEEAVFDLASAARLHPEKENEIFKLRRKVMRTQRRINALALMAKELANKHNI